MTKVIKFFSLSLFSFAGCHHATSITGSPSNFGKENPDWKILARASEPSMRHASFYHDAGTIAVRFNWIRAMHRQVCVSVGCIDGRYFINTLELERGSDKVSFEQLRPLNESEISKFKQLCSKSSILTPLNESEELLFRPSFDGARWMLDSRLDGKSVSLPLRDMMEDYTKFGLDLTNIRDLVPLRAICLWLISASGLNVTADEIY